MSIDGIWTGEVYGPFGWENRGIFVLENGRIIGGDNRQYTTGTYSVSGNKIEAEFKIHYYGPPRTVFGEKNEEFSVRLIGTVEDDSIEGTVSRRDKANLDLQYRLTKRRGLDSE